MSATKKPTRRMKDSRGKGLKGEREVAAIWQAAGATVRGLEGQGDHLVICSNGLTIHSEVKRQERWSVVEWWRQTITEAPLGTIPALAMRKNHGEWLSVMRLEDVAWLTGFEHDLENRPRYLDRRPSGYLKNAEQAQP